MTQRPETETRADRFRQLMVALGTLIVITSLAVMVVFAVIIYTSGNNHHTATVRQSSRIEFLLKEVKAAQADGHSTLAEIQTLETEVASVIEGLPAADTALGQFAQWLEICVGQDHEVGCPAPPIPTG